MTTARCKDEATEQEYATGYIEQTITREDTTYEVYVGQCNCCARPVYRLMRTHGASLSIYEISKENYENIDKYVDEIHMSMAVDVVAKLIELRRIIDQTNANGYFEAEGMHPFRVRLIDKARLICNRFAKNGQIRQIMEHHDGSDNDIASAFILGCIATECHWLSFHEAAVLEGYAHIEGRESGRPLALAARIRQGKRTRSAVASAAFSLYDEDQSLRRNDTKTANRIVGMKLATLRKRDGTFLGAEAIVKHLRAIRCQAQPAGKFDMKILKAENRV